MTPLPSKERLAARQTYDPLPGSVTPKELCRMNHRKKKHLSDWAVGCLAYGMQKGIINQYDADIFESVFVRGAKLRKTRLNAGHPFLGPDGEVVVVQGVALVGEDPNDDLAKAARIPMSELFAHPKFNDWEVEMGGGIEKEPWPEEKPDTDDETRVKVARPRKKDSSGKSKAEGSPGTGEKTTLDKRTGAKTKRSHKRKKDDMSEITIVDSGDEGASTIETPTPPSKPTKIVKLKVDTAGLSADAPERTEGAAAGGADGGEAEGTEQVEVALTPDEALKKPRGQPSAAKGGDGAEDGEYTPSKRRRGKAAA